jgi:hypothetical protein
MKRSRVSNEHKLSAFETYILDPLVSLKFFETVAHYNLDRARKQDATLNFKQVQRSSESGKHGVQRLIPLTCFPAFGSCISQDVLFGARSVVFRRGNSSLLQHRTST